jgi:hypothetical protein
MKTGIVWMMVLLVASCTAKNEGKQPVGEQTPVREHPKAGSMEILP